MYLAEGNSDHARQQFIDGRAASNQDELRFSTRAAASSNGMTAIESAIVATESRDAMWMA
jgi:hypothetical protein